MLPVAYRLSLAVSLVLLLSVLVTAALNFLKFNQVMQGLEDSRYRFVTRDLKNVFEQNLNLGLPLGQIDNARAILDRQLALDPAIARIEVFDPEADILYAAGRLDPDWVAAQLASPGSAGPAPLEIVTSRPIVNDFGLVAGGVAVYRSTLLGQQRDRAILRTLAVAVAGALVAGMLIVVFGATRLLRDVRQRLLGAAESLGRALGGASPEAARETALAAAAARTLAEIATLEAEVDRLRVAEHPS